MATQNRGGKGPRAGGQRRPGSPPPGGGGPSAATNGKGAAAATTGKGPAAPSSTAPRRLGQQQSNAPRRLGQQPAGRPRSSGSQRRAQRARRGPNARWGWLSAALVVVVVLVFVLVKVTGGNNNSNNSTNATASGQHPAAAPASLVNQLASTPLSVQSAAGIGTQATSPFETIKNYTALTSSSGSSGGSSSGGASSGGTVPRVVFVGAEFCPYCAVERYAVILALSRLGTFNNLKVVDSGSSDGDIPTWSFLGSTYRSKYVSFTPYETEDRDRNPLVNPPASIENLWTKQDTTLSGQIGWPYMNFGGKYALTNFPSGMEQTISVLDPGTSGSGAGLTRPQIVAAVHDPSSSYGSVIDSTAILAQANYIDAAVCSIDGGKPASLCQTSGVKAAMAVVAQSKPVKA